MKDYVNWLNNKNLSTHTINNYLVHTELWLKELNNQEPTQENIAQYLKKCEQNLKANTIRLKYAAIRSYLTFKKQTQLLIDIEQIKLPTIQFINRQVLTIPEFEKRKAAFEVINDKWTQRDWLIFSILFLTGLRASELNSFEKSKIEDDKITIKGKGNKTRTIFIVPYLKSLLDKWPHNTVLIGKKGEHLCYKQVNKIVTRISKLYFKRNDKPHDLRRAYATNLLRNKVDLKTVSLVMGHSNINTTSRYIHLNEKEIAKSINSVFK